MSASPQLTIIYDNETFNDNLKSDWGFACHIKTGQTNILFDTGAKGSILLQNMEKLNINPKEFDIVFLSHFHWDHTGGLKEILSLNKNVTVYYPQSFPEDIISTITNCAAHTIPVAEFKEIVPDVFTLGEFAGNIPEQAMVIKTEKGLIVITGCAHPGITTILEKAKNVFPDEPIYLALGGFHLYKSEKEEIINTLNKFSELEVKLVAPTHCSGNSAINLFSKKFGADFIKIGAGKLLEKI